VNWSRYIRPVFALCLPVKNPVGRDLVREGEYDELPNIGTHVEQLVRDRDKRISYWMKKAFYAAPNDLEMFSQRGWNQFLEAVSTVHVLHDGMRLDEELGLGLLEEKEEDDVLTIEEEK